MWKNKLSFGNNKMYNLKYNQEYLLEDSVKDVLCHYYMDYRTKNN